MIPELGHFALILVFCLSLVLSVLPMLGSFTNNTVLMNSGRTIAPGVFVFALISYAALMWSFLQNDFSVAYVQAMSNVQLPTIYKITATWGGHEGSLLLWILMQSGWLFAVSIFARSLPASVHARVLSVMGLTMVGMLMFILLTSNPFDRLLPGVPQIGSELNPLLQHPGLIIHPPILYMGYCGMAVSFSFAMAALIGGHLDSAWARWSRPWVNVAWALLTLGIGLGSWWAYSELGWGFWWGWDPTENNSLFPWLIATALVHSLVVTEKRGLFKAWTLFLSICGYSMVLLSTYVIRSGKISSVHAFASGEERGAFLLAYVLVVTVVSLFIYAIRVPNIASLALFRVSARESFMLLNNIVLVVLTAFIMFATFFPVISEWFGWGTMSVGPPVFNLFWSMITMPLCLLMAVGTLTQWKQTSTSIFTKYLTGPLVISLVAAIIFPFLYSDEFKFGGAVSIFVSVWIFAVTINSIRKQIRHAPSIWLGLRKLSTNYWSMVVAHLGIGILVFGAGLTSVYSVNRNIILQPGGQTDLFGYTWQFDGVTDGNGPNYFTQTGIITILKGDNVVAQVEPEKRMYSNGQPTTESGIHVNIFRDLYVSLGEATEPFEAGGWVISIYVKPFIFWIWTGCIVIALGGFMALIDKRYRLPKKVKEKAEQQTATETVTA